LKIGFKGRIELADENAHVRRFVKIVQEDRVISQTEVINVKYDIQTFVDLRYPFRVVFEAPNTLTKSVLLDLNELHGRKDQFDDLYPLASLDMTESSLDSFTYHFPFSSIDVAKFEFDSTKMRLEVNQAFVNQQKQRIADAQIAPPAKGKKRIIYWENGNKKAVLKFKKGQLNGKAKWYREDGSKERFVKFKNGAYWGKYITFSSTGEKQVKRVCEKDERSFEPRKCN
jgi:antitoxin component YwqK of YwqJK toxin-antitoxin module